MAPVPVGLAECSTRSRVSGCRKLRNARSGDASGTVTSSRRAVRRAPRSRSDRRRQPSARSAPPRAFARHDHARRCAAMHRNDLDGRAARSRVRRRARRASGQRRRSLGAPILRTLVAWGGPGGPREDPRGRVSGALSKVHDGSRRSSGASLCAGTCGVHGWAQTACPTISAEFTRQSGMRPFGRAEDDASAGHRCGLWVTPSDAPDLARTEVFACVADGRLP